MPFMTNGKRDYKKEANWEKTKKPGRAIDRAERMKARRAMEKAGKVSKNDNKMVDHKVALTEGGSNKANNWRVVSDKTNLNKEALRKKRAAKK